MASPKQLAANRANSQKSTGPITEAGKLNSRLNAVKHVSLDRPDCASRTAEQDAAYNTYRARLYPDLSPGDDVELDFAERIICDSWRIHRASAIESNLYALADAAFDTGNPAQDDALNEAARLPAQRYAPSTYSASISSVCSAASTAILKMLCQMQRERKAAAANRSSCNRLAM